MEAKIEINGVIERQSMNMLDAFYTEFVKLIENPPDDALSIAMFFRIRDTPKTTEWVCVADYRVSEPRLWKGIPKPKPFSEIYSAVITSESKQCEFGCVSPNVIVYKSVMLAFRRFDTLLNDYNQGKLNLLVLNVPAYPTISVDPNSCHYGFNFDTLPLIEYKRRE